MSLMGVRLLPNCMQVRAAGPVLGEMLELDTHHLGHASSLRASHSTPPLHMVSSSFKTASMALMVFCYGETQPCHPREKVVLSLLLSMLLL